MVDLPSPRSGGAFLWQAPAVQFTPMNTRFDFLDWLQRHAGESRADLIQSADDAAASAERAVRRIRGVRASKESYELDFVYRAGQFLFWLRHNAKPDHVSDADWVAYRPICEALIAKGELPPSALAQFPSPLRD